jgi:hypothetical protein
MISIVRDNLLNEKGYTPYCGSEKCRYHYPRTRFNGSQFECSCGWVSKLPESFIQEYKARLNIK